MAAPSTARSSCASRLKSGFGPESGLRGEPAIGCRGRRRRQLGHIWLETVRLRWSHLTGDRLLRRALGRAGLVLGQGLEELVVRRQALGLVAAEGILGNLLDRG